MLGSVRAGDEVFSGSFRGPPQVSNKRKRHPHPRKMRMALHTVEVVIAGFDGGYQPAFKKSGPFPVQTLFVSVIPKHQAKKFPTEPIGFADYLTALKQADDVAASILCFKSASPFASAVCLYVVASAHRSVKQVQYISIFSMLASGMSLVGCERSR